MLYSTAELFLDAIVLLLNINDNKSKQLVQSLIEISRTSMQHTIEDKSLIEFYIRLAQEIIARGITAEDESGMTMVLLKFQSDPAAVRHAEAYEKLKELAISASKMSEESLTFTVERLQNYVLWYKCNNITRKMFGCLQRSSDTTDPTEQRNMLHQLLDASKDIDSAFNSDNGTDQEGMVEQINFTDRESMKVAYSKYSERKELNVMRLGLQGLNMMFGKRGGPTLGESIVFNALSHNGKSLLLMSFPKWIVKYNKPPVHPDGKKPLILFVSLENEANENMMWWFKSAYENTFKKSADGLSVDSIIDFLYDYFNEHGYTFVVERYLPSEYGFDEFARSIEKYEKSGYFVVNAVVDYTNNMKKTSRLNPKATNVGNYLLVKELYSNMCNYTRSKGILYVTAHQLNRGAADLVASGVTNAVKKFNASHMADSMDVQREVDMSIYMHIETNHLGHKFMTFQRDKHRYVSDTPEAHKYVAIPFTEFGLMDDIDEPPNFTRDIYSETGPNDTAKDESKIDINNLF